MKADTLAFPNLIPYYGLDLGIKRGAICRLVPFSDTSPPSISFLPWPMAIEDIPLKDTDQLVRIHSEQVLEPWFATHALSHETQSVCFGDWTLLEVQWGKAAKTPASFKSFLAGLYTGALSPRILVSWIPPSVVRRALSLPSNCPKEATWEAMATIMRPCSADELFSDDLNEHEKDALVLALLAASHYGALPWMTQRLRVFSI